MAHCTSDKDRNYNPEAISGAPQYANCTKNLTPAERMWIIRQLILGHVITCNILHFTCSVKSKDSVLCSIANP